MFVGGAGEFAAMKRPRHFFHILEHLDLFRKRQVRLLQQVGDILLSPQFAFFLR
jgi:hypothetical protein